MERNEMKLRDKSSSNNPPPRKHLGRKTSVPDYVGTRAIKLLAQKYLHDRCFCQRHLKKEFNGRVFKTAKLNY